MRRMSGWQRTVLRFSLAASLVGAASVPAPAHHGWSGYDSDQVMNLTGVITESGYEHPHGHVRLEVPGKVWLVVLAPPSRMERRGLAPEALQAGTTATVVGYPHKTHTEEMRAERITVHGKTVELR
jgi:hypothetical protein